MKSTSHTSHLNRKVSLAFGSAILTLMVVGVVSYRVILASNESGRWVRHTHEVLESLQNLLSAAEGVESNCRGFALTGKESFLESYRANILSIQQEEANVRSLTVDNAEQQHKLSALEIVAAGRIQLAEMVIRLRQDKGMEAAANIIQNGSSQQIKDEFQGIVQEMRAEELRLLVQRDAEAKQRLSQSKAVLIAGTLLGILIAAGAGWSNQRENTRLGVAEQALRESEEQYRMLLDGVQDYAIYMLDPHGQVVSWNAGAEQIKGYTAEQIVGHNYSCFFPPEEIKRGIPEEILRRTAAGGKNQEQGIRVRRNGSRFLADITLTALRDPAGNLRGFSEFSHDLSENKLSVAKYRGLLEAAPDAMVVVNEAGEIVQQNVRAEKQFGYSSNELVGQKVKNIIQEGFAERLIADALRSAKDALDQQIGTGIELIGRRKNGSDFPIEIMLSPFESAEGILVTAAIRDITARKEAEANLFHKMEELKRSNEELGQFAYIASHDLQEPLRMVASYTQLLFRRYKGKLDSDADEFIAFAVDGASRMQRLIQDLLAYSRVGTKGQDLIDTSSEEALQQALNNLHGAIEESGAQVTHDPLPRVLADETQLIQLFQNLIGNGIKYQSPGIPRVHISAAKNGGEKWVFSVKDNGLGIDPQYFEKIFGMFQRLHKREEFAGTGIGLAICKKIVERHGGSISVESQPGHGSIFRFALERNDGKS